MEEGRLPVFLRGMGLKVQRKEWIQEVLVQDFVRRVYNIPMPNSLWHIDSYHKLIKWRIVIHGGIDGSQYTLKQVIIIKLTPFLLVF